MRGLKLRYVVLALVAVALAAPAAGTTKAGSQRGEADDDRVGGIHSDPQWVKPFEKQTGCKVSAKYARLVRRDGDADALGRRRPVRHGLRVRRRQPAPRSTAATSPPSSPNQIPDYKNFFKTFQSPPNNTVKGKHYGISLQWGPNTLLYNTKKVKPAPTSWSALYSPKFKGKITVPNNPIQIADAALYLSKTKPSLGIKDPYELNKTQFDATIALLKQQRPLVKKYWGLASDEISLFKNGDVDDRRVVAVPDEHAPAAKVPVKELIPKEGATGWLDTWMVSAKAKHPKCASRGLKCISSRRCRPSRRPTYGETPVNKQACAIHEQAVSKGSCALYHANAPESYYASIKFWKTPVADCGNGKKDCMDYSKWVTAWNEVVS